MRDSSNIILEKYQVRKSKNQKIKFIEWLKSYLKEIDVDLEEDKYSKNGTNIIIGNVEEANVIITAHYDTQANSFIPLVMGISNWLSFILSQLILLIPLVIILLIGRITLINESYFLSFILYSFLIFYSIQVTYGIPNKHTANDNTSGIATVIAIIEDLPYELKEKVCFVLFDQEEVGLIGSSNFKKKYKQIMSEKLLINFDCVSDGDTLFFVTKKKFRESTLNRKLLESVKDTVNHSNKTYKFGSAFKNIYTSDQIIFKNSVGVFAAKKSRIFGYYLSRIHSKWDTKFDSKNIELLSKAIIEFIYKL